MIPAPTRATLSADDLGAPPPPSWSDDDLERPVDPPVDGDAEAFIRIRGLQRRFGSRLILRGIDLDVPRGSTLVILGLSGSGKTTLFRHLMGTLLPQEGSVRVDGKELADLDAAGWQHYRRQLGVVFQNAALLGSLTVEQNVAMPLTEVERQPLAACRDLVVNALRRVFLPADEILALYPSDLSGGMRKRVGIARAIIQEPQLLLYDEPTTGLDPVTVAGTGELIREMQQRLGLTSVVITHDLDIAFKVGDAIAMLYKGRIIACGPPDAIRANPHPVLQQLLRGEVRGPLTEGYI